LEEEKQIPISLPIAMANDIGYLCALFTAISANPRGHEIMKRLEPLVPRELIELGREGYKGDLEIDVTASFSYQDLKFFGEGAVNLPSGREFVSALPNWDPNDRPIFDEQKNRALRTYLFVETAYVDAGGKRNVPLVAQVGELLS
jgi:hypothetical protein